MPGVGVDGMLRQTLEAVGMAKGADYFCALAAQLSRLCGVDYAAISHPHPGNPLQMRTVAVARRGEILPNIDYELAGAPCERVVRGGYCYFPAKVRELFPHDLLLTQIGVDSYMGMPLFSTGGRFLGLVTLMHGGAIEQPTRAEALLRVLAAHAGVELEREGTERALRDSEALARGMLHGSPIPMAIVELAGDNRGLDVNAQFTALFGYTIDDVPSLAHWWSRAHPDPGMQARMRRAWSEHLQLLRSGIPDPPTRVVHVTGRDGVAHLVEVRARVFGERVLVLFIDLTERERLERAFLEASRAERARLALEVHDGLGQQLTGLSMMASTLALEVHNGGSADLQALRRLADAATQAAASCRSISHGLMPLSDTRGDLERALRELVDGCVVAGRGPTVSLATHCEEGCALAIDVAQRDHLYRIAQEALSNALRHSRAARVSLKLCVDAERVCVSVEDDGCGLAAMSSEGQGLGMHTMRYRARAAGGRLVVAQRACGGTSITASCPNHAWAINAVRDLQ